MIIKLLAYRKKLMRRARAIYLYKPMKKKVSTQTKRVAPPPPPRATSTTKTISNDYGTFKFIDRIRKSPRFSFFHSIVDTEWGSEVITIDGHFNFHHELGSHYKLELVISYKDNLISFFYYDNQFDKTFTEESYLKWLRSLVPNNWVKPRFLGKEIPNDVVRFLDKHVYSDNPLGSNGVYRLYQHDNDKSLRFKKGEFYILIYQFGKDKYEDTPLKEIIGWEDEGYTLIMEGDNLALEVDILRDMDGISKLLYQTSEW